jgi:glycosyltransferase involved in cell wall biosynthesis
LEDHILKTIGFVVATKDRPHDLRRMLESLVAQTRSPDLVIVVDSSAVPVSQVVNEFCERLSVRYLHHFPPSASAQRNAGIEAVPPSMDLIAFLDDDATLEPDALENMSVFWANASPDLAGAGFNMVNHPDQALSWLKRWPLVKALGLYSGQPGQVTQAGWQTMTGFVRKNIQVDWLSTCAVVWRSEILRSTRFDEFFSGYSYLEDLELSYKIRRHWRLAVVADARYCHYPSTIRHVHQYGFGKTEVRNRLYFVAQHDLSYRACWLGLVLRMGITLYDATIHFDRGAFSRVLGNCMGMAGELKSLLTGSIQRKGEVS